MKLYMLDTDISNYILKKRSANIMEKLAELEMDQVCISVITRAELLFGVEKSKSKKVNRGIIDQFLQHLTVLDWGCDASDQYAKIRTQLERSGTPIGANDTMIASHAKSLGAILVTNNSKHFKHVIGLAMENWTD